MIKNITHGTPSTYTNKKCRCDICKAAWAKYARKYTLKYYEADIERARESRRRSTKKYLDKKRIGGVESLKACSTIPLKVREVDINYSNRHP